MGKKTGENALTRVLALMGRTKFPSGAEGSPEKNFHRAFWSLCRNIKDLKAPPLSYPPITLGKIAVFSASTYSLIFSVDID